MAKLLMVSWWLMTDSTKRSYLYAQNSLQHSQKLHKPFKSWKKLAHTPSNSSNNDYLDCQSIGRKKTKTLKQYLARTDVYGSRAGKEDVQEMSGWEINKEFLVFGCSCQIPSLYLTAKKNRSRQRPECSWVLQEINVIWGIFFWSRDKKVFPKC